MGNGWQRNSRTIIMKQWNVGWKMEVGTKTGGPSPITRTRFHRGTA